LREQGHVVDLAGDGREGLLLASTGPHDIAIVDRMLPGLDGLAIVETIRAAGVQTPVLFLTTMGGVDDRVEGLNAGGDDYLIKPFAFSELLARITAIARRPPAAVEPTQLKIADLEFDLLRRRVSRSGRQLDLQPIELRLLEYLMRNAGRVVTRTMLLEHVWDYHFDPQTNVIDVHISRLRSKIDKGFAQPLLHTVRGAGYMIRDDGR
jgi:two-component system, OmpR family, response regulator